MRDPRTRRSVGQTSLYLGVGGWIFGVGLVIAGFVLGWFTGWGALGMAALGLALAVGLGIIVMGIGTAVTTRFTEEGISQVRPFPFRHVRVRWASVMTVETTGQDAGESLWLRSPEARAELALLLYEDPDGLTDLVNSRVPSSARDLSGGDLR